MEDEGIALVRIEVGGADGSDGYVLDAIVVHAPAAVSIREGAEQLRLSAKETPLLRHWREIKRARATMHRFYPPKHGLDKVIQHGLFFQLFFPRLSTYHSAYTLHRCSGVSGYSTHLSSSISAAWVSTAYRILAFWIKYFTSAGERPCTSPV